jgi:hypothetical protein
MYFKMSKTATESEGKEDKSDEIATHKFMLI